MQLIRRFAALVVLLWAVPGMAVAASVESVELVIDADFTIAPHAARAIEAGVRTALAERDYRLGGLPVRVVSADHRGNAKRSHRTMRRYLESDSALAFVGGKQSPSYVAHRDFMNENGILTLLPWSAAGPITRAAPGQTNWIFRLSVDDTKAGDFLVRHAIEASGCSRIALLLIDTPWGRSGRTTLTQALVQRRAMPATTVMFASTLGEAAAREVVKQVTASGADCVIMLAEPAPGVHLATALAAAEDPPRVISHWGILSGSFADDVPSQLRDRLQLQVLQTCGLMAESAGNGILASALALYRGLASEPRRLSELKAATGFVHGYDLMRIVFTAADAISEEPGWKDGSITDRREMLRDALERIDRPVRGILGPYDPPFRPYSHQAPDAHEALGPRDLCMTRFDKHDLLVLAQ